RRAYRGGPHLTRSPAHDDYPPPARSLCLRPFCRSLRRQRQHRTQATVVGDVRDRHSLDVACRGARTVVSTITTTRSRQPGDSIEATDESGQVNLVDAVPCGAETP